MLHSKNTHHNAETRTLDIPQIELIDIRDGTDEQRLLKEILNIWK